MKPNNIVYGEDDGGYPYMDLTWKERRFRLYPDQKPQFTEQRLVLLPMEAKDLVAPRKYESPAWGYFPGIVDGLTDDPDLFTAWTVFREAVDSGKIWNMIKNQGGQD